MQRLECLAGKVQTAIQASHDYWLEMAAVYVDGAARGAAGPDPRGALLAILASLWAEVDTEGLHGSPALTTLPVTPGRLASAWCAVL